jgi:hypothetical protein
MQNKFNANKLPNTFDPEQLLSWKRDLEEQLQITTKDLHSYDRVKMHPMFSKVNSRRSQLKKQISSVEKRLSELKVLDPNESFYKKFVDHVRSTNKPLYLFILSQIREETI